MIADKGLFRKLNEHEVIHEMEGRREARQPIPSKQVSGAQKHICRDLDRKGASLHAIGF
jgi:hypothetical protein